MWKTTGSSKRPSMNTPTPLKMANRTEKKDVTNLIGLLRMEKYVIKNMTLGDILEISKENSTVNKPQQIEDVAWCTLRKIMALNSTARNNLFDTDAEEEKDPFAELSEGPDNASSIHPLDVLCVLMHCSDSILQQEIVSKMSMCQFAVPLLLPAYDGSHYTLMLWAMRDIVKKWRPLLLADSKGFREENVVNVSMPLISFVRMGKTKLSKSKTLNQLLNPAQQQHGFFIQEDMEGGNIDRKISEGLVEISWYFPSSRSDVFSQPFAVTNLRGDLESNWDQFTFLSDISSAVFIFLETINENEFQLLSRCSQSDTVFYFVVSPSPGKEVEKETKSILLRLLPVLRSDNSHIISKGKAENDANFIKKIQPKLQNILKKCSKNVILGNVPKYLSNHNFVVDENSEECQKARDLANKITREIQDVVQYKNQTLKLQGDLWRQLSKLEKELCRMKNQGEESAEKYHSALLKKCNDLHSEQYKHQTPNGIKMFIDALSDLSQKERQHFLKWMKFKLDAIARANITELQSIYKEKCTNIAHKKELQDLDQKLSDSSLGIEHFVRELGQFYEAECSITKQKKIGSPQKKFSKLPGIAADLLLDGFPLELIDGDASNIPLQWITDVLNELNTKTGGKCKMRVITVLGVQSTGKSTLLNTMFGLQFPVASGRCTRGAFMTLLNVKENFCEKLGCHFILVIDTEGLKAQELASLADSHEHDNELATLVVGLSDITIVNMAMENTTEMKDILQIVVHAFLRMKEIGKKPNCQFIHQNVSDVSAHDKNMRDRKKLLELLNEMTKVAAKMEKKNEISAFTDVMKYDLMKDNWYIPGLWQGDPPMAPVNLGYSSNVHELKMYLLEVMERDKSSNEPSSISDFITWIESLWRSVKHEKFIFSFRNSLVAKAYNKLSVEYSLWDWGFSNAIQNWVISTENKIRNQSGELYEINTHELQNILLEEENKMIASLERYFENSENANLIERYREEFKLSITSLRKELERNALSKCREAVSIHKGKLQIQEIQRKSQTVIEERITNLLQRYRSRNREVSEQEIQQEFELMWKTTLSDLHLEGLKRYIVDHSMLHLLTNDMSNKGPHINEALIKISDLRPYGKKGDKFYAEETKHLEQSFRSKVKAQFFAKQERHKVVRDLAAAIIQTSDDYVKEKMSSRDDYNEMYAKELLHKINEILNRKEVKKLNFTPQFVLDIKLYIFGKASKTFQDLHDNYIQENDPKLCLEKLKPQYLATFFSIFHKKDECHGRASQFCELCLKPAITEYVFKHLGQKIVDDILNNSENVTFGSRSFFQCTVLEELLEEMSFQKYVTYISTYESFTKQWILTYITNKYGKAPALEGLQGGILSLIDNKIKTALKNYECLKENSVSSFLEKFCELLKAELVISQEKMQIVTFHNLGNVRRFSSEIDHFLTETQQQIQSELRSLDIQTILSKVIVKPQDELFRKVVGCGKQCPFCKVPCEAGGGDHKNHAASIHRPQGLGRYRSVADAKLFVDICSTLVASNRDFKCLDTEWKFHPYKDYHITCILHITVHIIQIGPFSLTPALSPRITGSTSL